MHANYVALGIVAVYIIGLGIVTSIIQRSVKTANVFTTGTTGRTGVPAVLVGMMLMSEFIGTSASVGTAQEAYKFGISAAWNIIALAAGFVFYGFFLAGRYKSSGHNTISAILNDVYGRPTKLATSLVMIFALEIVAVAIYAGGGTILSALLGIHKTLAIVICGVVSVLYVFMGGMKSVVYTNIVHSIAKYVGICVALYFGLTHVGGWSELHAKLPPEMFSWHHVGFGKIMGDDGKPFKTRSGDTVKLGDLLDEAQERAFKLVSEKSPELSEAQRQEIARVIGLGAVKYADLLPNRQSDYIFSWDKMLALQGNTAPYLQYAYARIRSIFRKAEITTLSAAVQLQAPEELALAKHLLNFGLTLEAVGEEYRPNYLCNYLFELAGKFTSFYENCPVLKAETEATRQSCLVLCDLTAKVLQKGLATLGIETVEQM